MERPIRVAKHGAREENDVGLRRSDDVVRLRGCHDHSHGAGADPCLLADTGRKRRLVTRPDGNLRSWSEAAGRTVDQIDSQRDEFPHQRDGIVDRPAAFDPVGRGDADFRAMTSGGGSTALC